MKNYHGNSKQYSFFEGWYLKHKIKDEMISFIPAFHIDRQGKRTASLQIITPEHSYNIPYLEEAFFADEHKFFVSVGENIFCDKGIRINIDRPELKVKGTILYGPFTRLNGDIMGPFHYLPNMQCNHGVLSMTHRLKGKLEINGRTIDFSKGMGYIEKDWGTSFPKKYLWTQCSWIDDKNCSVMVSAADIPLGKMRFDGCICGISFNGKQYRLATYFGARILKCSRKGILIRQGKYLLRVRQLKDKPRQLAAPDAGEMTRTVHESLACRVSYQFFKNGEKIFDVISETASFETGC